ncbi:hypothetical protein CPB84DRAFT_1846185 [Gymnopilus junonius]|uniref:Uncharacterized protein n=1 Tax=Gymnopilus junonius TaxID=109634 RepID=A0A9P5TPD1_GYMJU|nr:hypothetical protein CPB84DRAFT_1846185 [Gymnopilus junonius]
MAKEKLPLEARRIRLIIVSLPILVASSLVLYKRLVLGEEQRKLPQTIDTQNKDMKLLDTQKKE